MIRIILTEFGMSVMHAGVEAAYITEDENKNLQIMLSEDVPPQILDGINLDHFNIVDVEVRDMRKTSKEDRVPRRVVRRKTGTNIGGSPKKGKTYEGKTIARSKDVEEILSLLKEEPDNVTAKERRQNTHHIAEMVYGSKSKSHIMSVAGVRAAKARGVYD